MIVWAIEDETMTPLTRFTLGVLWIGVVALTSACNPHTAPGTVSEVAPQTQAPGNLAASPVAIDPPAQEGAFAPGIFATDDGNVLLVWMEPLSGFGGEQPSQYRLQWSEWTPTEGWRAPETIVAGGDFFANWADTPMIARDSEGRTLVSFARKSGPDTYAYDVVLARKDGPGQEWRVLGSPHHDKTQTEHGFVSMVPRKDGVQVIWLDGRQYATPSKGPMTLRTAFVGDTIREGTQLDGRVCDCCNTAAALVEQRLVVLYRDRDPGEIRDVAIVQETTQGWSSPEALHTDGWNIAGCPVNGPAVHSNKGQTWSAWFTGADNTSTVKAAVAPPGGSFGEPLVVARGTGQNAPLGRAAVALLEQDEVAVVWLAGLPEGAVWRARRLSAQGKLGDAVDIVPANRARTSGFARLAPIEGGLVFVFTDAREKPARLRALRLGSGMFPTTTPR